MEYFIVYHSNSISVIEWQLNVDSTFVLSTNVVFNIIINVANISTSLLIFQS